MNAELKRHNESIAGFQKAIAEEEAKIAQHSDGRREEAQRKLKAAEEDLKRAESLSREIVERRDAKKEERRLLEAEGQAATATVAEKQQAARDNQMAMQRMLDAQNDQLAVYGSGMARSLEQIRAARWYGEAPLGPFGQYVKLRDEKWAPVMRLVLGHLMFGFRITDGRDRQQLKHILDANRWYAQTTFRSVRPIRD